MDVISRGGKDAPQDKPRKKRSPGYGKDFESDLLKCFARDFPEAFTMRITDSSGYNPATGQRYGQETPADLIVLLARAGFLIECKATKLQSPTSGRLEFNEVKDHQRAALSAFRRISKHHIGVVAVCYYFPHSKPSVRVKRCFLIDIAEWKRIMRKSKLKSLPLHQLVDGTVSALEIPWVPGKIENGGRWQVGAAMQAVHERRKGRL